MRHLRSLLLIRAPLRGPLGLLAVLATPLAILATPLASLATPVAASVAGLTRAPSSGPTRAPAAGLTRAPALLVEASDHPVHRFVDRERAPGRFLAAALAAADVSATLGVVMPTVGTAAPLFTVSTLDCEHATHTIALDPRTGVADAHLDLRVRASGGRLSAIGLSLDEGLTLGAVSADGRTTAVTSTSASPILVTQIELSPALAPGESTVVHVAYAGTLGCGSYPNGAGALCTKNDDFSYFARQSVIPEIFDPADPRGATLDALTRDIVLSVPSDVDVIATGERVSETSDGRTKVSTWTIDHPLSRTLGMYVFAGKLGMRTVPGRSVPTTFVFPSPELPVDERLISWSGGVLDFVEAIGGGPLPFQRSMTLVRLPANVGDPGTATFGMTLLSDSYAHAGDLMHEETWAHENSHLFWGIVVPERSSAESRMLSEGLATLSQIDYSWGRHFASEDRDTYLARRFLPIGLDLRADGKELPSIQISTGVTRPDGYHTPLYTLWAYYKTSATLDHLRVTIGDDAFARGLTEYVKRCRYIGCRPDDLRAVLEGVTGRELATFFDRWVTSTTRPSVTIGFAPVEGGADVELTKDDARPMTLELWLTLDDGQRVKRRVELGGRTTSVHLDTGARVRTVALSPRHDVMVDARSAVLGDLDFDGETDGLDLLRCTPLLGRSYKSARAAGLWNTDERFDPRCDLNGDLTIDEDDLAALATSFGNVRPL